MAGYNNSVFASGAYSATWSGAALGLFVGDQQSPTIEVATKTQPIDNTDALGRTTIGGIKQGADAFYTCTFMEWKAAVIAAIVAAQGALGRVGPVGADLYDDAQSLVLTAQAGSLAAAVGVGPATITASKAVIAPNTNYRLILGPVLREVAFRMQLFPYLISSNPSHYSIT
jgi:hypothetical protein